MRFNILKVILVGFAGFSMIKTGSALSQTSPPQTVPYSVVRGLSEYVKLQEQNKRETWSFRKQQLLQYLQSEEKNEVSLSEYTGKAYSPAALAKTVLVFHQLRRVTGDESFSRISRQLLKEGATGINSWESVQSSFETGTGKELSWFFSQWTARKGLPDLRIESVSIKRNGKSYEISFDLAQTGEIYSLEVPFSVSLSDGTFKTEIVKIDRDKKRIVLVTDEEPLQLVMDRDYDIPRRLTQKEIPPLLATLFRDEYPVIVPPATGQELYATFIDALIARGAEVRAGDIIKDTEIKTASLIVLGNDNPVISRLYGKAAGGEGATLFMKTRKNPWAPGNVIVMVRAATADAARQAADTLTRFENYTGVEVTRQGAEPWIDDSQRGVAMELREPAVAIDLSALKSVANVVDAAAGSKIVYIGEYHDRFAHHGIQLQVIKRLHQKGGPLALGMEMFQRPYQNIMDDYINGVIEERTFLKKTEYFKRWGFDYNLYKPILDFAREQKIPVIALNQKKEITEKVSKGGLDSLDDQERKEIPLQMDFSDESYRDRLKTIFDQHKGSGDRNFDSFYQAQVLWDETMALSIDEFMQKHPDHRMVVIAGGGHLAYGSGIPKRVFRRNGLPYFIALNDGDVDKDIADYLILPQPLEGVTSPKLMTALKVEDKRVTVSEMPDNSVSRKAGISVGDMILSVQNEKIESVEDLKLILFYAKQGETVKVKVLRKRFLLADKEMEFDVKL